MVYQKNKLVIKFGEWNFLKWLFAIFEAKKFNYSLVFADITSFQFIVAITFVCSLIKACLYNVLLCGKFV